MTIEQAMKMDPKEFEELTVSLERKANKLDELVEKIEKEQYNEDGTENEDGDLCTIGEAVLNHLNMWT